LFQDETLDFYGIKTAKIKGLINVELPIVEVAESSMDYIFLLEDNTYLHYEFETSYKKDNLIRFAKYDLRVYERDNREINTVVIYSADVKNAATELKIGSLTYTPNVVMMCNYDGNAVYAELEKKLREKQGLSDKDILNLIFLPLMRNTISKIELVEKSIELSQQIDDENKREACIASAFAFSVKYLNDTEIKRIWEGIKMSNLNTALKMIITDEMLEVARKAIKEKLSVELISKLTGLDIETIEDLREQLEQETEENAE